MYRTIMVPTDCSGFDREAIRVALRLAGQGNAKVHLVRILSNNAFFGVGAGSEPSMNVELIERERDAALAELYALAAECRLESEATVTVALEHGPVADTLAAYARREEVDLIVISSHGRTGLSRLSLGSVTDSLIRHTTIPVLVVKPIASYLNPQVTKPLSKIVVPLDGSTLAEQIIPKVAALALLEAAELTLLYVLKPRTPGAKTSATAPWWEEDVANAEAYLARQAHKLRCAGFSVGTDIVIGENIAEEIASFARRERVNLIAIATHGRGGLSRLMHGSVADAVTRTAMSSMLVFHPEQRITKAARDERTEPVLSALPMPA